MYYVVSDDYDSFLFYFKKNKKGFNDMLSKPRGIVLLRIYCVNKDYV